MKSVWNEIEKAPHAESAFIWKRRLREWFTAIADICLRDTKRTVKRIPCDKGRDCSFRVRKQDGWEHGEFLDGVCGRVCDRGEDGGEVYCYDVAEVATPTRTSTEDCDNISLLAADVKIFELKWRLLGRAVAKALNCGETESEFSPGTWQIATAGDHSLPVVLTIQPDKGSFRTVVAKLAERFPLGFILLAPTKRFFNAASHELLTKINAGFFDLESHFTLTDDGKLEADKLGTELFARQLAELTARTVTTANLPIIPAKSETILTPGSFLIRQDAIRQRRGTHDRTLCSSWRIWYKGNECLLPALVGSDFVVFLIMLQGSEFDASALTEAVRKSLGTGGRVDANAVLFGEDSDKANPDDQRGRVGELNERFVIWDETDIEKALAKIQKLEHILNQHKAAYDVSSSSYLAAKAELEGWQEGLRINTRQVGAKFVPKVMQKGTKAKKAEAIRKDIRNLLDDHVRRNCRPLFDHLHDKQILKYGFMNSYRPEPRIPWDFKMKGTEKGT